MTTNGNIISYLILLSLGRGLRLFPGKEDCLGIDVVDTMGRNTIVTTPTLMGLEATFNAQGQCDVPRCIYM